MAYLGHPLMGDDLYGAKLDKISRQALHRARLGFYHPIKNEYITVTAEIPEDMQSVINNKEDWTIKSSIFFKTYKLLLTMPGQKNLCAFLTLAMTATLFAGCSGNSDS